MQVLLVALISPWKGTQSIVFTYLNQLPVTVQRAEFLKQLMSFSWADEDNSLGTPDSLTFIPGSF